MAVLLKLVHPTFAPVHVDPRKGGLVADPAALLPGPTDESGLEMALRLRSEVGAGSSVTVVCAVPMGARSAGLGFALACGADEAKVAELPPGSDALFDPCGRAWILDRMLGAEAWDLVLAGERSPDTGSAQIAARIARARGMAFIWGVTALAPRSVAGAGPRIAVQIQSGVVREEWEVAPPAVLAIARGPALRYPTLRGRLEARRRPPGVLDIAPHASQGGTLEIVSVSHPKPRSGLGAPSGSTASSSRRLGRILGGTRRVPAAPGTTDGRVESGSPRRMAERFLALLEEMSLLPAGPDRPRSSRPVPDASGPLPPEGGVWLVRAAGGGGLRLDSALAREIGRSLGLPFGGIEIEGSIPVDEAARSLAGLACRLVPRVIVFPSTPRYFLALASAVAAAVEMPFVCEPASIRIDPDGAVAFSRPILRRRASLNLSSPPGGRWVAAIEPGGFPNRDGVTVRDADDGDLACWGLAAPTRDFHAEHAWPPCPGGLVRTMTIPGGETLPLEEAEVVVAGGRGMGWPEGFTLLRALAKSLGGAVGCSRAACDLGFADRDAMVGQTGRTVSPRLYVACGISGATQHVCGMSGSETIVAINRDPRAPIAALADLALVGDAREVIPALVGAISSRSLREEGRAQGEGGSP